MGCLLASVVLVFGTTMGAALIAMSVGQILARVALEPITMAIFSSLALANAALLVLLLRSIGSSSHLQDAAEMRAAARSAEATTPVRRSGVVSP